ncbi:trypsin-like serine protease [Thalassotalea fonticola]|uniref:Trypsin-like serine protease n=1 Tax=Thalassotalea fonticola TaxID=3065649 RepID=A0ABZ0GVV5_9GAMM|nr:trypsin-like serine protease [Colwelliaceae bacterium S1-1]
MGYLTILILLFIKSSFAVTDGEFDGDSHPHVGLLIFDVDGAPAWRCSGTLLSSTVMLTAGHCTSGATGGRVWFENNEAEIRADGYPFSGETSVEFDSIHTSPDYNPEAFFLNDLGIVILSTPVILAEYATLPNADALNALAKRRGKKNQTFTAVGYGLQKINPVFVEANLNRMFATPRLIQINSPGFTGNFSMLLSNNHSTGGTCFGDSGGPNFMGDSNVVGGVTSFGINGNCAGTGGVYRMDRAHDIEWINLTFLAP